MRTFESGAIRDQDADKYDFEAFLSPLVIDAYGAYMHQHRQTRDGQLRDGDNWQKGFGVKVLMKSLWRHFFDLWCLHRGMVRHSPDDGHLVSKQEACCAIMFNVMGYLHEILQQPADTKTE